MNHVAFKNRIRYETICNIKKGMSYLRIRMLFRVRSLLKRYPEIKPYARHGVWYLK